MTDNGTSEFNDWPHGPVSTGFIIYGVALSITITVVGNILVCLAVMLVRKLRTPPNFLLVSLALTDLGVGALVEPLSLVNEIRGRWTLGPIICKFYTSADVTLCTASILNLCAISVDRYMAITHPLTYCPKRTGKRFLLYVLCVWILALLISVTPLIVLPNDESELAQCQVTPNMAYQIYATMGSFYIPACTMLIVNYKIFRAARRLSLKDKRTMGTFSGGSGSSKLGSFRHRRVDSKPSPLPTKKHSTNHNSNDVYHQNNQQILQRQPSSPGSPENPLSASQRKRWHRLKGSFRRLSFGYALSGNGQKDQRKLLAGETKAIKTLGVITGAFIVCWLPFFALALIKAICGKTCFVPNWLDGLILWLGYLNSALNPLLYAKYNRDFRIPFREMLCCRFKTLQTVLRHEEFTETFGSSATTPSAPFARNSSQQMADSIVICNGSYRSDHDTPL